MKIESNLFLFDDGLIKYISELVEKEVDLVYMILTDLGN
jgi:hypothetical protein